MKKKIKTNQQFVPKVLRNNCEDVVFSQ